ncbi:hypothetical protein MSAN_01646900 [Mycena sanguinolenta]|uniref:Uncharacterized protein n=1 Tax=Mycena sanguinolenta TaxID=230812 RepID=A0A8H7CXC9_9AGAR|nr:hypothetical protein MSAN_01646900 [Mycena sanguinolenta]
MLDHYYTPRDDLEVFIPTPIRMHTSTDTEAIRTRTDADIVAKPRASGVNAIDLSALALEQLVAFDCDSDDSDTESGSDDGYVSTLLRIQRALPPPQRKIAGARRVARAASAPVPTMRTPLSAGEGRAAEGEGEGMDVDGAPSGRGRKSAREGELFQSITAIPGLQGASFEELRLETYRQSLAATGTARPQPALAPPLVIPPAWASTFVEAEDDEDEGEGDEASSSSSSYSGSDSASGGGSGDDADLEIGADADLEIGDDVAADVEMRDAFGKTQDPRKKHTHTPTLDPRKAFTFRAASYPPAGPHTQGQAGW